MDETTTTPSPSPLFGGGWSDPLEDKVRGRVRAFIEAIFEEELSAALGRGRYERAEDVGAGWRNGHRDRQVIPMLIDHDPWAQARCPRVMMRHGWSVSLFHASQQRATMSS